MNNACVLITGAGKRLGRAMALDMGRRGYDVVVHCNHSVDEAKGVASEIAAMGRRAHVVQADLTDHPVTAGLIDRINSEFGRIDMLVNNASIFENDDLHNLNDELWDRHFDLHVRAPCQLASGFARQDLDAGLVVNIIDQRVWKLNPRFFSYTLSKSALWTATQTMAQALAPAIRVNAIGPGPTIPNERQSADDFALQVACVPLKKGPELSEFGRTIDYMWKTPSLTGQMLALDGGQHLIWDTPDVTDVNE